MTSDITILFCYYLQKDLEDIEETIYTYEGRYLEETNPDANVVLGWDDYHPSDEENKKNDGIWKAKIKPKLKADRLFSNSSVTFKADRDAEDARPSEEDSCARCRTNL